MLGAKYELILDLDLDLVDQLLRLEAVKELWCYTVYLSFFRDPPAKYQYKFINDSRAGKVVDYFKVASKRIAFPRRIL